MNNEREIKKLVRWCEVYSEDFPGETFRVLKEKDVRLYGGCSALDVKAGVGGVE